MLTNCFLSGTHILPQLCSTAPLPTHGSLWPAGQSPKVMEQHLGPFRTSFRFAAHFLFHPARAPCTPSSGPLYRLAPLPLIAFTRLLALFEIPSPL